MLHKFHYPSLRIPLHNLKEGSKIMFKQLTCGDIRRLFKIIINVVDDASKNDKNFHCEAVLFMLSQKVSEKGLYLSWQVNRDLNTEK